MKTPYSESMIAPDSIPRRWTLPDIALLGIMLLLLVPGFSNALYCGHEQGWWPVKPRDYNMGLAALATLTLLLCKPTFCVTALALLAIPLPRLLDAAFLQRYEMLEWGGHDVYVLMILSLWIISAVAVLSTGTSKGPRIAVAVAVCTIIACTGANVYEWLGHASWTRIPGRMAGWHMDPNNSPIVMCLMLGILFTLEKSFWWNCIWAGVAGSGIALTMSRSGMAVFIVMAGLYVLVNVRKKFFGIVVLTVVAVPLLALGLGILGASHSRNGLTKNADTASRMEAIYNLDFEKLKSPERGKDLLDAWEAVCKHPLAGCGTGAGTVKWRPHNMLVAHWIDVGLIGILQYAGGLLTFVFFCVTRRFRAIFCLIPVLLFIPCSQVLLDMPAYWYAWGVAALTLFPKRIALVLGAPGSVPAAAGGNVHA
jgi:O-Antigen ligase